MTAKNRKASASCLAKFAQNKVIFSKIFQCRKRKIISIIKSLMFRQILFLNVTSNAASLEPYFVERMAQRTCSNGSMILDRNECASACNHLGSTPSNNLNNGRPCYIARNGKCRQNGAHGSGASLICKHTGNQII